jgi:hypothetical protein
MTEDELRGYVASLLEQGPRERGFLRRRGRRDGRLARVLDELWPGWRNWRRHPRCGDCSLRDAEDERPRCAARCLAWKKREQVAMWEWAVQG